MATTDKKQGAERAPLVDAQAFRERIVAAYNRGIADRELPADREIARSLIPPGTAALRDFSYLAPDIPRLIPDMCVGCMDCVTQCPDTAIVAKVVPESVLEEQLAQEEDPERRARLRGSFMKTTKYYDRVARTGEEGGFFGLFVDPTKCKGCAECVEVCGSHAALEMIPKNPQILADSQLDFDFYTSLPATPKAYINQKALSDMMLESQSILYVGGAGSCMGCGEATALRMLLAATGFVYGTDGVGLVCATGCNTVYGSTYPYNPFLVPWTNPLFENAPAVAMGVRLRWDQQGMEDKKLWNCGGSRGAQGADQLVHSLAHRPAGFLLCGFAWAHLDDRTPVQQPGAPDWISHPVDWRWPGATGGSDPPGDPGAAGGHWGCRADPVPLDR